MMSRIFDSTSYALTPLSVQTLGTAAAILCLGIFALIRESASRVSMAFSLVTLSAGAWLFCFSWMYSAADETIAFWWAKAAFAGIAFIPAALYHFRILVLQDYPAQRGRVQAAWALSVLFLAAFFMNGFLFDALYRYPWGFYPKLGLTSIPFLLFASVIMLDALSRFLTEYRRAPQGSTHRMRIRAFLIAFAIGSLASPDFAAAFGIPLYPFGYAPMFLFLLLSARAIWSYRFVDITPAFAAPQIINTMNDALFVLDQEEVVRLVNRAACDLFGYREEELVGKPANRIMIRGPQFTEELESFIQLGMAQNFEMDYRTRENALRTLSLSASVMRDPSGEPAAIVCVARDITERKRAEEDLRRERDTAQKYLDVAGVMLVVIDASQKVARINLKGCEILGYREDEIVGKNWFDHFIPERLRTEVKAVFGTLMAGEGELFEYYENPVVNRAGEERIIAWHSTVIKDNTGAPLGTLSSGEDVTGRKQAEKQIQFLAFYDSLTGLPNRTFYKELLGHALAEAQRRRGIMAILFIDLDYFKRINDSLGHDVGDQLLRAVADLIAKSVRKSDIVARSEETENVVSRLGGDEFIVLLSEISHAQDASRVARRILMDLSRPFTLGGREVFVSGSIGIALYPLDGQDAESLIKNADVAMYHAKTLGRNNYQFYAESMNASALQRLTLENELHKALERGEFLLHYQPTLDVRNRAVVGAEALVRWKHPDRGLVPPGEFIPLAEETGLIVPIGEWVLYTACSQSKAWQDAGLAPLRIAVNLSSRQFDQQNLIETVSKALQDSGLDPRSLELEITESAIMQNPEKAAATLRQLKERGIRVSIDDFGTGYSSLAHLRRFPLDTLKVDRSFVKNITMSPDDAAITTAVIAMAHSLKLTVIAEGVETEQQEAFLRDLGCDEVQGFLFSKPVPAEDFVRFLKVSSERR